MPGPRNIKKRKVKKSKPLKAKEPSPELIPTLPEPTPIPPEYDELDILPPEPPIHDPGNGPRVKNIHVFLGSSFCSPPSMDDELCAEFAQEEMLDMLYTVLPRELALVSPQ
jgi:hypothetical protein